ncbi:MAG: hypothetical protein LBP53_03170 [Candidatus Peribacteria bacterium]|jgi:hypothetical protein|nr:hypothetical protein [Candidatus Peribacteria bacterium]
MTSWLVDLDATGNVNVFLDKLKQAPNMEETLRTVFRKSISVISYYQSRKRKLDYQLALQYLEQHESGFSSFDEKKKQRKIRDYLSDGERYDKHIKSGVEAFLGKTLYTSVEYMQKPDIAIFDGEVDPLIEESMEMVEERKNDCLEIDDEDDESVVFDIKAEIKEGKLTPKGKEKLQNLCEDWEEEIDSFGKDARYNRYLPILSMFDINASDTMEKLQRTGDYEEVVKSYKDKIQEILKKSSDGTLREADLDELEIQINDYYKFEKSLTVSALNVSESRDENGDIVATWISTFYKS